MPKFKPGDKARIIPAQGDGTARNHYGHEVTILAGPFYTPPSVYNQTGCKFGYKISTCSCGLGPIKHIETGLEPIQDTGSWDDIEASTGWKPGKEKAKPKPVSSQPLS